MNIVSAETWRQMLEEAIAERYFPGAALAVVSPAGVTSVYAGRFTYDPDSRVVDAESLWDMASATKVMATTSVVMRLVDRGELDLEEPLMSDLPKVRAPGVTYEDCLRHEAGWAPYVTLEDEAVADVAANRARLLAQTPVAPRRSGTVYSCLSMQMVTAGIEARTDKSLPELFVREVAEPMGLTTATFYPRERENCVPTEENPPWRVRVAKERNEPHPDSPYTQGSVHDPACYLLGGAAGNAGLFATLEDVARWGKYILGTEPGWVAECTLAKFQKPRVTGGRGVGFDRPSPEGFLAGLDRASDSFGHLGFTGTLAWFNSSDSTALILLTNRVHPQRDMSNILGARRKIAAELWR